VVEKTTGKVQKYEQKASETITLTLRYRTPKKYFPIEVALLQELIRNVKV